ncbi:MAG: hypothetical protein IID40_11710 [Planctomycetes bacterium]|nr:hypothetical protein [Planctomycetota bacterium]
MNVPRPEYRSPTTFGVGVGWVRRSWTRVGRPHGSRSTGTHATLRRRSKFACGPGARWRNLIWAAAWATCGCGGPGGGDWFGDHRHQPTHHEPTVTDVPPDPNESASTEPAEGETDPPAAANPAADPVPAQPADSFGPVDVLNVNEDRLTVDEVLAPLRTDFAARLATAPPDRYWSYVDQTLRTRIRGLVRDLLLHQEASRRLTDQENEMIDQFTDQRIRNQVQEQHGGRQVRWERAMADRGLRP